MIGHADRFGHLAHPGDRELDHQLGGGGEGRVTRCTMANVSNWRGRSTVQVRAGASRGTSSARLPAVHDGVGQPATGQLDRGLDVLDLDPGLRVVAGLVQHLAQRQPHRVRRPVAGVGHDQLGLGEPAGGDRGRRTFRVGDT